MPPAKSDGIDQPVSGDRLLALGLELLSTPPDSSESKTLERLMEYEADKLYPANAPHAPAKPTPEAKHG